MAGRTDVKCFFAAPKSSITRYLFTIAVSSGCSAGDERAGCLQQQ